MNEIIRLVVFRVNTLRYALPLAAVERIIRAVEVTTLPSAAMGVCGMIDVEGRVLPVLNLRQSFGLPEKEISVTDQFVIARTANRNVVLVVDEAEGLMECEAAAIVRPHEIADGLDYMQGVVKLDDGMVVVHDLETVLSLHERRTWDDAPRREAVHAS